MKPILALVALLAVCTPASASVVLFDNIGPPPGISSAEGIGEARTAGFSFMPSMTEVLESVEIPLAMSSNVTDPAKRFAIIEIWDDIGTATTLDPATILDSATIPLPFGGPRPRVFFSGGITLDPSETYWVTARTSAIEDGIQADLLWGQLAGPVPGIVARRSAGSLDPHDFSLNSALALGLRVYGIPEPSRALLSLLGIGAVLVRRRR